VQDWLGKRKAKKDGTEIDEAAVVDAAGRRGIAFSTNGALISLIANRREEEQAVVEAAIRELEDRNQKTDA
jgi:hypothetical protein